MIRSFTIIFFIFCLDLLTKIWRLQLPPSIYPWPGVLEFTQHTNYGLIANIPVPQILILLITIGLTCILIFTLYKHIKKNSPGIVALSCIVGGALGNIFDRISHGYVFDWILIFHTSIINIADIAILIGIFLYLTRFLKYRSGI